MDSKGKSLLTIAAVSFFAIVFWQGGFFSILDSQAAAPLISQIDIDIGRAYEGTPTVVGGTTITANWEGTWQNRNHSPFGGDNIAGLWFLDGEYIGIVQGNSQTINKTYCYGTHPLEGCIGEYDWDWKTIPIAGTLPVQGNTTAVKGIIPIDTTGLEKGTHQITMRVFTINGSLNNVGMFACGTTNGVCCPLLTESQGFPCAGIYGTTQSRNKSSNPRCTASSIPEINENFTFYECPTDSCGSCGQWCCENWQGIDSCYNLNGLFVTCDESGGSYKNWSAFSEWETVVGQTKGIVMTNAIEGAETVAIAEFEVVKECETECCIGEIGVKDKLCTQQGNICSGGNCVFEVTDCPTECCENDSKYFDKTCEIIEVPGYGTVQPNCVLGECVSEIDVQCNIASDCSPPPCSEVEVSCEENVCFYEGKCISEPKKPLEYIFEQIVQISDSFWQWFLGFFET